MIHPHRSLLAALACAAFPVLHPGLAGAAIVDASASAFGYAFIAGATDLAGRPLAGPVSGYFSQGEFGSELAQIDFVSVTDRAGNDRLSAATLAVEYGNGFSSLGFLDPTLFYDGAVYGGIALIESFTNISGQALIADVVLAFDLDAYAASQSERGTASARADVSAEGHVNRIGAFTASESAAVSVAVQGIGSRAQSLNQSWHYSVRFQPADRMEWVLILDSQVAGTLAPVPLPASGLLLLAGLGGLTLARRRQS